MRGKNSIRVPVEFTVILKDGVSGSECGALDYTLWGRGRDRASTMLLIMTVSFFLQFFSLNRESHQKHERLGG